MNWSKNLSFCYGAFSKTSSGNVAQFVSSLPTRCKPAKCWGQIEEANTVLFLNVIKLNAQG